MTIKNAIQKEAAVASLQSKMDYYRKFLVFVSVEIFENKKSKQAIKCNIPNY